MRMNRTLAALAMACVVALTGCSDRMERSGSSSAENVNATDVMFLQDMLASYQQTDRMSRMAESHGASPDVRRLSRRLELSHGYETRSMTACLKAWGHSGMTQMPMKPGTQADDGMMSGQRMTTLFRLRGLDFDRRFLVMMMAHHEGALATAHDELDDGINPRARSLAQGMMREHGAELETMERMTSR